MKRGEYVDLALHHSHLVDWCDLVIVAFTQTTMCEQPHVQYEELGLRSPDELYF